MPVGPQDRICNGEPQKGHRRRKKQTNIFILRFLCLFAANPTVERLPLLKFSRPVVDELSRMQATSPANKPKSSIWLLLVLGAVVAWASVETYRLWVATQQVAASQQLEMRVAAKLEAARAKNAHFAKADPAAPGTGANQK